MTWAHSDLHLAWVKGFSRVAISVFPGRTGFGRNEGEKAMNEGMASKMRERENLFQDDVD